MAVEVCTAVSLISQLEAWACLHHWQGVALAVHCAAGAGRALGVWSKD